eukprot:scaffold32254_cov35-Attheya_sp.AAC.2
MEGDQAAPPPLYLRQFCSTHFMPSVVSLSFSSCVASEAALDGKCALRSFVRCFSRSRWCLAWALR